MKICIIGHTERNYLPYMEKYVRFFEENGVDYTIVCWEREEKPSAEPAHEQNFYEAVQEGALHKIRSYLRFKRHVLSVLKEGRFDKLIVLTTVPAVFLSGYLKRHYRGRYLLDIRDYSFERYAPYRKMVNRLIRDSAFTTFSSKGFFRFLAPSDKVVMNHSVTWNPPVGHVPNLSSSETVQIGVIGEVRYYKENVALLQKLQNEPRYHLWYIGKAIPGCDLEGYCREQGIHNASFIGKFRNEEKPRLYENVDMINSIYGSGSLEVTTALPNRLYEACLFKKPILSSKGTYLGEVIEEYRLGLAIDEADDDVKARLDQYLDSFDPQAFEEGCEAFLQLVRTDEAKLMEKLRAFIQS